MGINVEITNVDTQNSTVSFMQDGVSQIKEVILPAKIQWAKLGKAEIGLNHEGKVSFIKSLEPRAPANNFGGQSAKPVSDIRTLSTLKVLSEITPEEAVTVYNNINANNGTKCSASTPFLKESGKYDVWFYITTFVKKDAPVVPAVNNAEMMGTGNPAI